VSIEPPPLPQPAIPPIPVTAIAEDDSDSTLDTPPAVAAPAITPPAGFAQHAAVFSVALWLFFITCCFVFHNPGDRTPILGILGIVASGRPRHKGILAAAITGASLNGVVLLIFVFAVAIMTVRVVQNADARQSPQSTRAPSGLPRIMPTRHGFH
jgi:hypothetical protein